MDTKKKSISVKQVMSDIRTGMSDEQLMAKYGLTQNGLEKLFSKLEEAGHLEPRHSVDTGLPGPKATSPSDKLRSDGGGAQRFDVQAVSGRKGMYHLVLDGEELTLEGMEDQGLVEVSKAECHEKVELHRSRLTGRFLVVHTPKRVVFKLDQRQSEALDEWIGPPTIETLKHALAKRFRFCITIGVFLLIVSVPLPGDAQLGLKAVPFDYVGALLGITLIGLAVLSRFWPRPAIFLLDGIWFLLLALNSAVGVYLGDSPWWLIASVLCLCFATIGFQEYRRFRGVISP